MFLQRKTAGLMLAAAAAVGLTTAAALPASASATNYFERVQLVWSEQAGQAPSVYCPCLTPG